MNPLQDSFSFLIASVFDIYMVLVLLRFLLQLCKANLRNPFISPIMQLTQVPTAWLGRFVPGLYGVALAPVVLLLLLGMAKILLLLLIKGATLGLLSTLSVLGLLFVSLAQVINMTLMVFTVALIAQAVLSWFAGAAHHPIMGLLHALTTPILEPIRRIMPATGALDFAPMIALIALTFLRRLLIDPALYNLTGVF